MRDKCRRKEDCGAGRKTYDVFEIPQNEMASFVGVEVTKGCVGTPAMSSVSCIAVTLAVCLRAIVDCGGCKNSAMRGRSKLRILLHVLLKSFVIFKKGFVTVCVEQS